MITAQTNEVSVIKALPRLTEKQQGILLFLCEYYGEHYCVPKHRDLCEKINVNSSNAGPYFRALMKKGYIDKKNELYAPTTQALEWLNNQGHGEIFKSLTTTKNGQMSLMIAS